MSRPCPRVRRHSRTRGAILVESLIVCSLLIVAFIGGLFFHRLYAAKMRAIREARFQVWQAANSAGCGGATIDLQVIASQAISALRHPSAPSQWLSAAVSPGMAGGTTQRPAFFGAIALRSQAATQTVSAHPEMGGQSYQLRATDQLACNELVAAPRGDPLSVFGFAARNLVGAVW